MNGKDIIKMSQKELKRLYVVKKVLDKELTQVEAAAVLRLSERRVRRIVKRVRKEGDNGLAHKSRGKPSARRFPDDLKERTLRAGSDL